MSDDFLFRRSEPRTRPRPSVERPWEKARRLDEQRERMEAGPGGDVDAGGRLTRSGRIYVPGLKRTVSRWLRLYERVQCGELGGPQDGLHSAPDTEAYERLLARMAVDIAADEPASFVSYPLD